MSVLYFNSIFMYALSGSIFSYIVHVFTLYNTIYTIIELQNAYYYIWHTITAHCCSGTQHSNTINPLLVLAVYITRDKTFTFGEVEWLTNRRKPHKKVYGWLNTMKEQGYMTCCAHRTCQRIRVHYSHANLVCSLC